MMLNKKKKISLDVFSDIRLTVADAGARGGLGRPWSSFRGERVKAILFEPDPEEVEKLRKSGFHVVETALGEMDGEATLHITRQPGSSSLYKPSEDFRRKYPKPELLEVVKELIVSLRSLDSLSEKDGLDTIDFIKLDVQGAELDILKGATSLLNSGLLLGIEAEVEFQKMYVDQPLFADVFEYVTKNFGYELFDLDQVHWRRTVTSANEKGQIVFGNALFLLPVPKVIDVCEQRKDQQIILKYLLILYAYGFEDVFMATLDLAKIAGLVTIDAYNGLAGLVSPASNRWKYRGRGRARILKTLEWISVWFQPDRKHAVRPYSYSINNIGDERFKK